MNKLIMIASLLVVVSSCTRTRGLERKAVNQKKQILSSISVITFGPNNVLFVGDPKAGAIVAFELDEASATDEGKVYYNIPSIDRRIASTLGAKVDQISIEDMAVHPVSREIYLAVSRGRGDKAIPVIMKVSAQGVLTSLNIDKLKSSRVILENAPSDNHMFWGKVPLRSFTITDMEFHNGELLVSGLSNEEFSSTFRRIEYPFNKSAKVVSSSTEIYHAVHNQNETRAPIRTFKVIDIDGEDHVLASYTCTPLVLIPLSEIKDGAHVKGKTIAELGYGNTPIDILNYTVSNWDGSTQDVVLITHNERNANLIGLNELVKSAKNPGLFTQTYDYVGPKSRTIPISGVLHVDDLNTNMIVGLKRSISSGELNLDTYPKSLYLKLSQFIVEYDYPGYQYPADGSQDQIKAGHKAIIPMEGYDFETRKPLNNN